ncbi:MULTISPECIES: S41 family peptidase [unclassified Fusibacter]|uniref:S41 family peptidase n=1 Tax=unclassified Fusibacter TaxID=2624464 RepID=UPI0010138B31|nr:MULTISPECIES: S41 family peptidase [unclassified Fusibacter]MCK8060570.1 S41 family peptidase [Fusibacter sp. A2]NPE22976.1 S41 family peptidase [Fusibacter sp. A1]RXV60041.1 S41 family peptidase [Fusibacter sp. A1]
MKKSLRVVLLITVIVAAMVTSSVLTLYAQFSMGERKVVLTSELEELKAVQDRYAKAEQLKAYIESNYYLSTQDIDFEEGVIDGIFSALDDPYSVYFTVDEFKAFNESTSGSYGGIGIVVEPGKDNYITVVSPIEDTPGEAAGLITGDKILKVDGVEVFAETMDAAIKRMKGVPGTDVILTIYREGTETFDVPITRAQIVIKSVKSRMLDTEDPIGYLRITSFDEKVFTEFVNHYKALESQNIRGLVIDLRNNPGGSLSEVIKIADYILGEQVIVSTKDNKGQEDSFESDSGKIDLPITVLVNGGSASASEILTGAIKDSESGTVIGTQTFGKGLVQTVRPLRDGDGIKLTIAQYFTPNGDYIHGTGIEPNIILEQAEDYDAKDDETDVQLQEAIRILLDQI